MDEKERNALLEAYSKSVEARMNTVLKHMQAGVKFVDASSAYIDESVEIGAGTVIGPCVTLEGNTRIGENCAIRQNTRITDSEVAGGVEIENRSFRIYAARKQGRSKLQGRRFCGNQKLDLRRRLESSAPHIYRGFRCGM